MISSKKPSGFDVSEAQQIKMEVTELALGMYVSALDRPWAQTNFPLQGFEIRSHREITAIRSLCQYVYIDPRRSRNVPMHKLAPVQEVDSGDYRHSQAPLELNRSRYPSPTPNLSSKAVARAEQSFQKSAARLADVAKSLHESDTLDHTALEESAGSMVHGAIENPLAMTWMALLQRSDKDVFGQSLRVATWALICARHMGLEDDEIRRLTAGVLIKDIYRSESDERLPDTRSIEITTEKLRVAGVHPKVVSVVKYHREKFNGTGVPYHIAGEKIPLLARIAAIATAYDEKIFPIDGSTPVAPSAATRFLYDQRGRAFQDELVIEFIECIGLYPLGTLVKLNTGETACVVSSNPKRRLRPDLLVLRNAEGKRLQTPARAELSAEQNKHRKIESDLPSDPELDTSWIYQQFLQTQSQTSEPGKRGLFGLFK